MSDTVQQAVDQFLSYVENGTKFPGPDPKPGTHGKVINVRQEAFYDVTVYEDGHEDRYYIGD